MPLVMEMTMAPTATAVVENMAMAASPLMRVRSLRRNSAKAAAITTGMATASGARLAAAAMLRAQKPTWERPSPIIE